MGKGDSSDASETACGVPRMRRVSSAHNVAPAQADTAQGAGAGLTLAGVATPLAECMTQEQSEQRSMCYTHADMDMFWTFLAGMLLYITSV